MDTVTFLEENMKRLKRGKNFVLEIDYVLDVHLDALLQIGIFKLVEDYERDVLEVPNVFLHSLQQITIIIFVT